MTPDNKDDRTEAAIVVRNLRKSFGEQKVLNGISLQVDQGETLAILGRSGTGKSVLLKLIIGLAKSDSGSIRVHGQEIANLSSDELNAIRMKIGFLFQDAALYDSLSVEENVAFPLKRHNKMSQGDLKDLVRDLLSQIGMQDHSGKMPSEISGGMKKRVGLARSLALDPDILLYDEPTAALDPITAAEIEELILKLQKERRLASIVVTHDLRGAKILSDRMALIHEGNVLIEGTFQDFSQSSDPFVCQFLEKGS